MSGVTHHPSSVRRNIVGLKKDNIETWDAIALSLSHSTSGNHRCVATLAVASMHRFVGHRWCVRAHIQCPGFRFKLKERQEEAKLENRLKTFQHKLEEAELWRIEAKKKQAAKRPHQASLCDWWTQRWEGKQKAKHGPCNRKYWHRFQGLPLLDYSQLSSKTWWMKVTRCWSGCGCPYAQLFDHDAYVTTGHTSVFVYTLICNRII